MLTMRFSVSSLCVLCDKYVLYHILQARKRIIRINGLAILNFDKVFDEVLDVGKSPGNSPGKSAAGKSALLSLFR